MKSGPFRRSLLGAALCVLATMAATPVPAQRFGLSGTITYNGAFGPVNSRRPLCLCVFTDPMLADQGLGCLIRTSNNASYQIPTNGAATYYLIAFLDIDLNERVDENEPYEIYLNRLTLPADGVTTSPAQKDINFVFGDESLELPATETPTPSETPTATPTPPPECGGDCDGSATVTIDEVITLVNIALGDRPVADCPRGDSDRSGEIEVADIVTAIAGALSGCEPGIRALQ